MSFRNDLNGIRAIAVIGVVLFHFNPMWMPGGFAGVDVFFVISGFLMTKIIFGGLENNNFSLYRFYLSRAKRIIPALVILCFVLIVMGWFVLLSSEYQTLGSHAFDAILFISNITFWNEAGYFEAGSHEKWLLHTWSLSVEWQFYVFYPIALWILAKLTGTRTLFYWVIAGALLSFTLCVYASNIWPDAAYFLLPTRAWQMMLGGIVFFTASSHKLDLKGLDWALILALFICYLVFSYNTPWPSYWSAIPVLMTALLIQANNQNNLILNNSLMQKVGLWSYSIYLWHWPVVVWINNFVDNITLWIQLSGIVISTLLGALSYHYFERVKAKIIIPLFLVTISSAYYVSISGGAITELRPMSQLAQNEFVDKYKTYLTAKHRCMVSVFARKTGQLGIEPGCIDENTQGGILLWGDSHMGSAATGIRELLHANYTVNTIISSGCPSSFVLKQGNASPMRRACDYANQLALETVKLTKPKVVIIANKDKHEQLDWSATVATLKHLNVEKVIVLGPVPQWYPSLPLVYARHNFGSSHLSSNKLDKAVIRTNVLMNDLAEQVEGLEYIDVINHVCEIGRDLNSNCRVLFEDTLFAWDYGHMTEEGSRYVAKTLVLPRLIGAVK